MKKGLAILICLFLLSCSSKDTTGVTKGDYSEFGYWNEIQSIEVKIAFIEYMQFAYERFPDEHDLILILMIERKLFGVAVEAHEKWEVLEYLNKGYSISEIRSGKAYDEYKPVAHAVARFKELKFYQFCYRELFNEEPPAMRAFLYVNPLLKIGVEDIYGKKADVGIMKYLLDELKDYRKEVMSEQCPYDDLLKCLKFFEKAGYDYGDEKYLFLRRGIKFILELE